MRRQALPDTEKLKKARDRYKLGNEADSPQAQRERDDTAFEDGEQWPADLKLARMGQQPTNGQPAVPARPTLVINKVRRSVQQVLNQERESDIGIEIVPADDFGDLGITPDDTEVSLREGLVRRIQRESQAADARSWAFKRAVIAGRGYYLVMTRFLPGKTWDQEVYVHRIYNQAGVVLDPSHEQPDGSDAEWGFIGTWVPWERIAAEYPVLADGEPTPLSDYSEADFISMAEDYPDWYRQSYELTDKDGKKSSIKQVAVRVTDYWYVERTSRELAILEDGVSSEWVDALPEGVTVPPERRRTVIDKQIKFCKIVGGVLEVETTDWAGPDMPIIKVLGEEILPYDEQRRAEGMVRQARSSQMGLNTMVSKQVEMVGLTPIPPLMVDPDAIEGYEAEYQLMNVRTFGSLKYRTYDDQGRELRPPMRPPVSADNAGVSQSIVLFDQAVKDTTAVSDPALGQTDPSVKSARHAAFLIEESRIGNSGFLDNLARSIRYEGQVENNLFYSIYGARPGRLVRVLTGVGEGETWLIDDPEHAAANQQLQQRAKKVAKLTKDAHFNVIVKVAKSTQNRRQKFVGMFSDILAADPMQMAVGGDLFYRNMDIPEAKQLAERQRVMLAPPVQALLAAEKEGRQMDPAAQAEIAQLQERVQLAEQVMQEQGKAIETKQIEQQAKVQIAAEQAKNERDIAALNAELERYKVDKQAERDLELARMDNATKQYIADVQAKTKGQIQAAEHQHDEMATQTQLAHEAEQKDLDRQSQTRIAAHEAAMAEGGADRAEGEAERGRQATAEENERNRQAASESGAEA